MKKKMLAILGSPHTNGSTGAMLNCATQAALANNWEVTTIKLYEMKINYCKGCMQCMKAWQCVQKDDLQIIAEQLKTCDLVVLAAPTYWANVPAVVKNLFDRLFGTVMEETSTFPRPRLSPHQSYILLTACKTPMPFAWVFGQSKGSLRAMNEFFKTAGLKSKGSVVFAKANGSNQLPKKITKKIERLLQ